jgi:hypothetical protein
MNDKQLYNTLSKQDRLETLRLMACVFESYSDPAWHIRAVRFLRQRMDRRRAPSAHFIRDRRQMRWENFAVFMFLQAIMALTAFLMATHHADPRLTAWMLTAFTFSVGMFLSYKSLTGVVGWVKARSLI